MPDLFPERCPHCGQPISALDVEPDGSIGCSVVLTFPTVGKVKEWFLTASQVKDFADAFPNLDVLGICRKALAWIGCNPSKRKTARGMPKFLFGWLSRANDAGAHGGAPARRQYHDDRPPIPGMTPEQCAEQRKRLGNGTPTATAEGKAMVAQLKRTLANGFKP